MPNQYHSGPWTGFRTQYDLALQKSISPTCNMSVKKYVMGTKESFELTPDYVDALARSQGIKTGAD